MSWRLSGREHVRALVSCTQRAGASLSAMPRQYSASAERLASDEAGLWEYDHDVLVVGAGIVGSSLACRLAEGVSKRGAVKASSPPVRLIEARPPPALDAVLAKGKPDPRVYALAPSSARVLQSLGVWDGIRPSGREAVLEKRSQAFTDMQVWDDVGPGFLKFDEDENAPLGYIAEHGLVHASLFERVREFEADGRVQVSCPAQVKRISFPSAGAGGATGPMRVTVETAPGETSEVTCRLLVAADGGNSKVAKMLGLSSWGWGYGQRAVVATVKLAESHSKTAYQRYLSRGPLAMLPLRDDAASLVWSTTPEHAEMLKSVPEEDFLRQVNEALRSPPSAFGEATSLQGASVSADSSAASSSPRFPLPDFSAVAGGAGIRSGAPSLGAVVNGAASLAAAPLAAVSAVGERVVKGAEGVAGALAALSQGGLGEGQGYALPPEAIGLMTPRLGFDLSLRQAHSYVADRAALVGDAAHTIHPMAGQGLNLGIADSDCLARAILDGRKSGTDIGSKTILMRYEAERKSEALLMMGALDSLHRLFGAENRALAAVRSAGMSALNASGPVKRRIARHAMGGGSKGRKE